MEEGSKVKARRRQAGMMAWLRGPNGGSKRVTRRQESRRSRARRPCACAVHMTFVFRPAPKATRQGVQSAVLQMRARYALYVCPCIHASQYILKLDMCCTVMCTVCGACHRYATCCAECSMLTAPPAAFPPAGGAVTKDK